MSWMPSFDTVAQLGHFGWGALIFLAFAVHGHPGLGVAGVYLWTVPKEFIFDALVEGQSFKDNLRDFLFYSGGLLSGALLFFSAKQ